MTGLPPCILTGYIHFLERTNIYNSISGALGMPHRHRCGIPQGRPFSMLFVALFLRSWVVQMLSFGLRPRTLADDVLLMSKGPRALHLFKHGSTVGHPFSYYTCGASDERPGIITFGYAQCGHLHVSLSSSTRLSHLA
eukprot:12428273-Karenia_brevis.AAC.1